MWKRPNAVVLNRATLYIERSYISKGDTFVYAGLVYRRLVLHLQLHVALRRVNSGTVLIAVVEGASERLML